MEKSSRAQHVRGEQDAFANSARFGQSGRYSTERRQRQFVARSGYIEVAEPVRLDQRTVRARNVAQYMLNQSSSQQGAERANRMTMGRQQGFNGEIRTSPARGQIDDKREVGRSEGAVEISRSDEQKHWRDVER